MRIDVDDLSGAEIAEFLADHLRYMREISPPESVHALDLDELRGPEVTFWSARIDGALVGCGAVKRLDADHAELKSMRTDPARLRGGIASGLLEYIIGAATRLGYRRLSLETGAADAFRPARNLYAKYGFVPCEPFGDYLPDPHSAYLTLTLPSG